jgi:signal transduction histidine kinase
MTASTRRNSIVFFISLCVCLVALALALNVGWVLLNWRTVGILLLGVIVFLLLITGLILNTAFLVREIRRNEQHDAFINAVTHELKTPVASIRLYLETLQTREMDEAKRQEFYSVMLADTNRLLGTIEQVLRAGRVGTKQRHLPRARVELRNLITESVALARSRHRLSEDAVRVRDLLPTGEAATVMGDFDELQAAILNLLDNAVKYSGQEVRVFVDLVRVNAQRLAIRVSDQGIGISPDQLTRIFKRFYRIPDSVALRIKGTGLGLFIVRSVVERHGGRAFAESAGPGQGSTFIIELPAVP